MPRRWCQDEQLTKQGHDRMRRQVDRCSGRKRRRTVHGVSAVAGYRFPTDMFALDVRRQLRSCLSNAGPAELLTEPGIHVDPSTRYNWVRHFTPFYQETARAYCHAPRGKWSPAR